MVLELSWEKARHLSVQQLSPRTVGDARARQGVSEHQSPQKSLPSARASLMLSSSQHPPCFSALWEANHCRDSPSGVTWAVAKVCTGLADLP